MSEKPCEHKNPLQRAGKSQNQRFPKALATDFVQVDERNSGDLLVFAARFAKELKYFNETNIHEGDWREFIEGDVSSRLALIMVSQADEFRKDFERKRDLVLQNYPDFNDKIAALRALFEVLEGAFTQVNEWAQQVTSHQGLFEDIRNLIKSRLRRHFRNFLEFAKGSVALKDPHYPSPLINYDFTGFSTDWFEQPESGEISLETWLLNIPANNNVYGTGTFDARVSNVVERLEFVFRGLHEVHSRIISRASGYLSETLENWDSHKPHFALFLSFLLLFKHAQNHINTLTERHLDFYYQEVLRLTEKAATPDSVHIVFTLARKMLKAKVPLGTLLKAGKDAQSNELSYAADAELVINTASASQFKTVFLDREDNERVFMAPVANSSDGKGKEFEDSKGGWRPFGASQLNKSSDTRTMVRADLGLAIASPILRLSEGRRCITITLKYGASSWAAKVAARNAALQKLTATQKQKDQSQADFTVFLSAEKEWLELESGKGLTIQSDPGNHSIVLRMRLDEESPAIVAFDKELHSGDFAAKEPVIRIMLNKDRELNPYVHLRHLLLEKVDIEVNVTGMRKLVVQNDFTVLNADKNFQPFGPRPVKGANFYIGNAEAFAKDINSFEVHIDWANLPENGFKKHYCLYQKGIENDSFTADLSILDRRQWLALRPTPATSKKVNLFEHTDIAGTGDAVQMNCVFPGTVAASTAKQLRVHKLLTSAGSQKILRKPELKTLKGYDGSSQKGFIRLTLTRDFLHEEYVTRYTRMAIRLANKGTLTVKEQGCFNFPAGTSLAEKQIIRFPNEPYTPEIKGISLDYSANISIRLKKTQKPLAEKRKWENRVDKVFSIRPFGQEEVHPYNYDPGMLLNPLANLSGSRAIIHFVPQFDGEGSLYIGLKDLKISSSSLVSMLVQMQEGTANPDVSKPKVIWAYRAEGKWKAFSLQEIIADKTNGLVTSGILKLNIPKDASEDHTILDNDLHWLRATVAKDSGGVADIVAVHTQALKATFADKKNDPQHLAQALPAKSIKGLKVKDAKIKSLSQPYASFDGRMVEDEATYYTRVSERLRHKDRAITIWDYESLVLENFPSVYRVKCLNHTSKDSQIQPGHVYLVVVSNLINKNAVDPLKPRVSVNTRDEIHKYLGGKMSPFVRLKVENPRYEDIKVDFNVKIHDKFDEGFYLGQVNKDLVKFLTPWAYKEGADITFDGRLHSSVIVDFIEELPYVDYLVNFKMYHIPLSGGPENLVVEAIATTPMSILVSAKSHCVKNLNQTDCNG